MRPGRGAGGWRRGVAPFYRVGASELKGRARRVAGGSGDSIPTVSKSKRGRGVEGAASSWWGK
jgi:hypothetical protein